LALAAAGCGSPSGSFLAGATVNDELGNRLVAAQLVDLMWI
jgi:hypothetical protein